MSVTMFPPSGGNYAANAGKVVYRTNGAADEVTLATDVDGHIPFGVIVRAENKTNGAVTVAVKGDRAYALIGANATLTTAATSTFACLDSDSGVMENTSLSYIVGQIIEPDPANPRESGYVEIIVDPSLNPAP